MEIIFMICLLGVCGMVLAGYICQERYREREDREAWARAYAKSGVAIFERRILDGDSIEEARKEALDVIGWERMDTFDVMLQAKWGSVLMLDETVGKNRETLIIERLTRGLNEEN